jgi:two-component system cell cycle sensor histidine kinase/response regulator CckA
MAKIPQTNSDAFTASAPTPGEHATLLAELRNRDIALRHVNRALKVFETFSHLLVHADTEPTLLQEACRAIVKRGSYDLVWVGFAAHDEQKSVHPVAIAGTDSDYVHDLEISWDHGPHGQGPTGTTIREGRPILCRDMRTDPNLSLWRDRSLKHGFISSISLPLRETDTVFGAINIYAKEADAFDQAEVQFLRALGDYLSYGISALRTRERHQRAMSSLHENEERLRVIVEASPNGLCVVTPHGKIIHGNRRMESLFGYSAPELVGQSVEFLVPETFRSAHVEHRTEFFSNASARPMGPQEAYPCRRKDGTEFLAEIRLNPIEMSDGPMVLATVIDISARVLAEEERRNKDALFSNLVRTIPDKIYIKDRQGRFVEVNDDMARHCGLQQPSEAVGKSEFDFFSEEFARRAYTEEQRIMATGEPVRGREERETRPDGQVMWFSTTKAPLRDPRGQITGLVGISRDITAQKQLEAQFLELQKMEAFSQLAGGVAHDFNNILATMYLEVDLAQQKKGLTAELGAHLTSLKKQACRATAIIRQLLLFSRRRRMNIQEVELNPVLDGIGKLLQRVLGPHIAYRFKPSPERLRIEADPGMVEQIVMNLCLNARDAMPEGGRLTVETRARQFGAHAPHPGRYACITVTDTGCGMDAATKAHLFEPFFTTKPVGEGSGLGLAAVYGILEQHHGWAEADSTPGSGTTFRVYFPLMNQESAAKLSAPPPKLQGGTESILLVDDDHSVRSMVAEALRLSGYQVVEAASGGEGLRVWNQQKQKFSLLLTDYKMPGSCNGLQLAGQLSAQMASLRVIIMSGLVELPREDSSPWPAEAIRLTKPFSIHTLLATVRQCLDAKMPPVQG